jgi:undecaprenyl-diphosphatase
MLVQGLKISFRIERPFVIDKTFKPVESAVEGATGYSFPSGHTQSATSLYGYFASAVKRTWLRVLFILAFLLVGFSRLYLGVHTYFDVGVSLILTLAIVFLINYVFDKLASGDHDLILSVILAAASILLCVYAFILAKTGHADMSQINDCFKSGGAGTAFALGFFLERKYLKFDVSAKKPYVQLIKFVLGVAGALIFKSGLKLIAEGNLIVDFVRYFFTLLWVIYLFPLIFTKILNKKA